MTMRLSVIIPYYNSDPWIGLLLDSLLDQDLGREDYEIIVIDDGSTEEPVVLGQYAANYSNVVYARQENAGVSAARNYGINVAKGKWIFFCDSDDMVRAQVLGKMLNIADEKDLDMLFWNIMRVDSAQEAVPRRSFFDAISPIQTGTDYMVNPPADFSPGVWRYLVRRDLIVRHDLRFMEGVVYVEDSLFRLDVMSAAKRVAHVDVDVYFYVRQESSIVHMKKRKNYDSYASYMLIYLKRLSELIQQDGLPDPLRNRYLRWRDIDAFYLLKYLSLYSSLSQTRTYLSRLRDIDAIPLLIIGKPSYRIVRWMMNHSCLWLFACGIIHLLPISLRQKID